MDGVLLEMGWLRFTDKYPVVEGELNADYLGTNSVGELKIFEEEGLLKKERQDKVSEILNLFTKGTDLFDIDIKNIPEEVKSDFENQIARPFQTAIKKASKQMKQSASVADISGDKIIIAVNNGFSYLDADNFERVFISRCKRDSKSIDYAACVTVEYHQGDFDAYIFCTTRVHCINNQKQWEHEDEFVKLVGDKFNDGMTHMMRDQLNPELWKSNLESVSSICFERDGIKYIRKAPDVPDSRFK
jgi:hypothetical protein